MSPGSHSVMGLVWFAGLVGKSMEKWGDLGKNFGKPRDPCESMRCLKDCPEMVSGTWHMPEEYITLYFVQMSHKLWIAIYNYLLTNTLHQWATMDQLVFFLSNFGQIGRWRCFWNPRAFCFIRDQHMSSVWALRDRHLHVSFTKNRESGSSQIQAKRLSFIDLFAVLKFWQVLEYGPCAHFGDGTLINDHTLGTKCIAEKTYYADVLAR